MSKTGVGVDGCRAGWLAIRFDGADAHIQLCTDLAAVADFACAQQPIWIDMPIGLVEAGPIGRTCDTLTRKWLSPIRHSSVFTPPCRAAVYADLNDASAVNAQHTGKKLSRQSINIIPKIRALDTYLLQLTPAVQEYWYEAHPELVFAAFNQHKPIPEKKKTLAGQASRLTLLQPYFESINTWFTAAQRLFPRSQVQIDDILDALALAIANYRVQSGQASLHILSAPNPADSQGLPMRIVFAE